MFYNDEDKLLFFKICEKNGNIMTIAERGYSYFNIIEMLEWAIKRKYIIKNKKTISLSSLGKEELEKLSKSKNNKIWIGKKTDVIVPEMELYDIYLKKG
ncbi:hypothetical protein [Fusobacterium varium]|uniref:hypothetical protein n=1 Tax=Fusobacterium varium TaxID=856 RepID=UPI002431F2ED|nr:hypothetical protein [Fusobacterium varium]